MPITPGQNGRADDFIDESERDSGTPSNDAGKVPKLGSDGRLSPIFNRFEGVRATNSSTQTVGSSTTLSFDSEDFDTDGYHDTATNNSRITVPTGKAGKYIVGASFGHGSTGGSYVRLRLNGSTIIAAGGGNGFNSQGYSAAQTIIELSDGDYIEAEAGLQNSTSTDGFEALYMYRLSS